MTRHGTPPGRSAASQAVIRKANPDGINRAARSRTCRRCGRPVFEGLDTDRAAVSVRVDAAPLSAIGEVEALMSGRRTYALTWVAGRARYEINTRDALDIAANPPGTNANSDAVSAHKCGAEPFTTGPTMIRRKQKTKQAIDPPF